MTNADVARIFAEIADLMEIAGEDFFRLNSYRKVARTIADCPTDLNELHARGEVGKLEGVGKAMNEKIHELLTTGQMRFHAEMRERVPPGLLALLEIPGLGPKKIAQVWHECQINSLEDLQQALDDGRIACLKGWGEKLIEKVRKGIAFRASVAGRTRLGVAYEVAETIRGRLANVPGVKRIEHAGSLRRGKDTIGDLDFLAIADDPPRIIEQFKSLAGVAEVLASGPTKASVRFIFGEAKTIQVDLRVVPEESFGAAWQYFTGSKEHNVRLRERAVKRGWSLNEYGLTETSAPAPGRVIASRTEEEIYAALNLPFIPAELREDRGEFDLTETPADLLTLTDIRGDLHMHTIASDGHNTIDEMAIAARERGYTYIAITDHSQSSVIANGLKPERLLQHIAAVRAADARVPGITILAGAEVDILGDGRMDYPDELLAQLDWVVASVHAGQGKDAAENTQRTLAAIRNPYVCVVAHPTGRLLGRRDAMPIDIEAVASEAARTGTALEINCATFRLDLRDAHARLARDLGAQITIDTDAHSTDQLDQMPFGVLTARRAWLRKQDVLNTRPIDEIRAFVAAKRGRRG